MKVTVYRGKNFVLTNEHVLRTAAAQPLLQPVLVLVPDRYTLQAERFLLKQQPHLVNVRVITFSLLYGLVADELNYDKEPVTVLDKTSAVLNLWTAIRQVQGQLTWFKNSVGHYDFAEKMFNTINQMRSSCVDFAGLENKAMSAVAKKKYHDINLIYQAYCKLIAPRTDSSGMLEYLSAHVQESKLVQNAQVYVCGFSSLSPARLQVLMGLCHAAQQVTIAASADEIGAQLLQFKPVQIQATPFMPETETIRNETERGEATIVVKKIIQLLEQGVLPEEIVVLLTEFDTLAPVWEAVAKKYQLPVNLDVGTKLSTTAEAKYLRDLLELLINDDAENTVSVLFNKCSQIADEDVFKLDEKIVAADLRASQVPEIKSLKAVKNGSVLKLCQQLKDLTANEKIQKILDQIATEYGEQTLTLREFITLFWTLCSATKVSNIPQYLDRVLIAPVNDWVPTRVKYLFIANCTADNFPQGQSDDDILQEADLVGTAITPTPSLQRERNYRQAELLKTVATNSVILSGTSEDFLEVDYQPFNQFQWRSLDELQTSLTMARDLYFPNNRVSTTMVEKYYSCPHLNFWQNGLRLYPRPLHRLQANTVGSAIHKSLQVFFSHHDLESAVAAGMAELDFNYLPLTKNIEKEIRFILVHLAEVFKTGKFNFETKVEADVARQLKHGLTLIGRVDRVDVADLGNKERACLILDYKTGSVDDAIARSIYLGYKLQLPVYSSILSETKGHIAGAGYLPLKSGYSADKKAYPLRGFIDQQYRDLFPTELVDEDTYAITEDNIAAVCLYANRLVEQAVEKILQGDVRPQAVDDHVCKYCPVKNVCPQMGTNYRKQELNGKAITFKTFMEVNHD